ncbi:MAG: hypothetical protein CVV28_11350 [Methanobacteriales archaeon HGW-Methanobacteriales-1]|jgi:hypothetical protein|nr:MAG: hypothetical protein CVV28_11350 [Methanobacteriales archaeon HGW-Methanobacteriales-1]
MELKNRKIRLILIFIIFFMFIFILSNLNIPLDPYTDLNSHSYQINESNNSNMLLADLNLMSVNQILNPHLGFIETLGMTPIGGVMKIGPYGNKSSQIKIAYIIGVHPAEEGSHKGIYNAISKNQSDLKYCYYIYKVHVRSNDNYDESRYYGQLLAYKYAVNDIKKNKFDMVVDVHANQGKYEEKTFVFTAIPNNKSLLVANFLAKNLPGLSYYIPPRSNEPTSAPYISEPLIKNGIPTIVYETYRYEAFNLTEKKAHDFIMVLDDFKF